jgi:hypothetical protein
MEEKCERHRSTRPGIVFINQRRRRANKSCLRCAFSCSHTFGSSMPKRQYYWSIKENIVKKHKSIWRILAFLLLLNTVETVHAGQQKKFYDPDRGMKIDEASAAAIPVSDHVLSAGIQTQEPVYNELAAPEKKCRIGEDHYFTYRFVKPPKMGTAILKIELFDKNDQRVTDLNIVGMSDMPSMRGAHDSGEVAFKLNKKGDYLMPVNIVMAGEWEIKLHFLKGTDVIYRGSFKFHV